MDAVNSLLDKAREMRSIPSDLALAEQLHVGRSAVSNYRHGRAYPDTVVCARLSDMTGEPLTRVLGIVGEARAVSAEEKRVWRRLAQAAAVAAVTAIAGWLPLPAQAATLTDAPAMHYAKLRTLARMLQRLWSRLMEPAHAPALLAAR